MAIKGFMIQGPGALSLESGALPANIRLALKKNLVGTNTLAYSAPTSLMKNKMKDGSMLENLLIRQ